jgi:hypothetical protein
VIFSYIQISFAGRTVYIPKQWGILPSRPRWRSLLN